METNTPLSMVMEKRIRRTMEQLENNNMKAYYAATAEDAKELVKSLLPHGATVACGGSMTLEQAGIMELLRSGDYTFLDRQGLEGDAIGEVYRKAFFADFYQTVGD